MLLLLRSVFTILVVFSFSLGLSAPVLASGHEAAPKAHGEAKAEGGEAKEEKKADGEITGGANIGDPVYIHLKPIVLPVISDKGAEQLVNIIVDLETKDYSTAESLNMNRPRVNDAIIRALYAGLSDASMRNSNALDIIRIKSGIRDTMNKTFGEGTIKDVLIQAVEQRKF